MTRPSPPNPTGPRRRAPGLLALAAYLAAASRLVSVAAVAQAGPPTCDARACALADGHACCCSASAAVPAGPCLTAPGCAGPAAAVDAGATLSLHLPSATVALAPRGAPRRALGSPAEGGYTVFPQPPAKVP